MLSQKSQYSGAGRQAGSQPPSDACRMETMPQRVWKGDQPPLAGPGKSVGLTLGRGQSHPAGSWTSDRRHLGKSSLFVCPSLGFAQILLPDTGSSVTVQGIQIQTEDRKRQRRKVPLPALTFPEWDRPSVRQRPSLMGGFLFQLRAAQLPPALNDLTGLRGCVFEAQRGHTEKPIP